LFFFILVLVSKHVGLRNATPAQIDTLMDRIDINGKVALVVVVVEPVVVADV